MERISGWTTRDITETRLTDKEGIGAMRWVGNKCYRWVLNSTGGALTVGAVYTFGTGAANGYFTEVFTAGQSTKGTTVNGIPCVAVSAIASAAYGWVQVFGEASAQISGAAGSNVASGDNLKLVSGQVYLTLDTAGGTAPTAGARALALAAGNSNAANTNMFLRGLQ